MVKLYKQVPVTYLASPYSHKNRWIEKSRYDLITEIAARLHVKNPNRGFILPITQSHNLKKFAPELDGSFASWRNIDLTFIDISTDVWVVTIDGWKESIGVAAEIEHAFNTGKKVSLICPETLKRTKIKRVLA